MPRAYSPRMSTTLLMARILAQPGVASVRAIAPNRHRGTLLRITLEAHGMSGPIHSDFTLADARAWLAAEDKAY